MCLAQHSFKQGPLKRGKCGIVNTSGWRLICPEPKQNRLIEPEHIVARLETDALVGVPYTPEMIEVAAADFAAQADPDSDYEGLLQRYPKAQVRNFDGAAGVSEMDALIAYLQVLGTMVDFSTFEPDPNR